MLQCAAVIVLTLLAGCATLAPPALPLGELHEGGAVVRLYAEPCALDAVTNLPARATWRDSTGDYEGCFDVRLGSLVVAWFEDRTVFVVPISRFRPPAGRPSHHPSPVTHHGI